MRTYQAPEILLHQEVVFEGRWGSGYHGKPGHGSGGSGKPGSGGSGHPGRGSGGSGRGGGGGFKPPWWS